MKYFFRLLKNLDRSILLLVSALAVISLVMISSTAYSGGFVINRDIIIQALAYLLGFFSIVVIISVDYKLYPHFERIIYGISVAFLLTVYLPFLGKEQYGARSWIEIPHVTTIQPSEFVKITFVILMAIYFSKHRDDLDTLKGVLKSVLYAAPIILIILKEDLGSAIVFCAIYVVMLFYAGIDYKLFAKLAGCFVASLPVIYLLMADHQKNRILAFLHPDDLSISATYQVWMSKIAIGSGGFLGKGLFHGSQKELDFLPVQKSDFIFSVVCEELGMVGGILLILLFSILLYRMALIARDTIDLYGALIVVGFIGMFGFQIFENIAMAMGMMPVTGITLPFVSYGGSSILSNMMAVGLVLSVGMRSKQINF